MFLFIDFTFHPIIELVLPNAYIGEQHNGYCVFYKKASDEVLRSLPNWELSSAEKEALSIINSLQPNELYQKYLKKGDSFSKIYQNAQTKKHIQEQIEDKTDKLLTLICKNELFITTKETSPHYHSGTRTYIRIEKNGRGHTLPIAIRRWRANLIALPEPYRVSEQPSRLGYLKQESGENSPYQNIAPDPFLKQRNDYYTREKFP